MRFNEIKKLIKETSTLVDADLFEIAMSPSSLEKLAVQVNAQAGMEFEMIVPNVASSDPDGEMEPDYDMDEPIYSIDDVYNFYNDGDYNSRSEVRRAREKMQEEYTDWLLEEFESRWDSDTEEFIYQYVRENVNNDEIAVILGREDDDDDTIEGYGKEEVSAAVDKIIADGRGSNFYDLAYEDAQSDFFNNTDLEGDWLSQEGLNNMTDIEDRYELNWPHWQNQQSGGEVDIDQVADDFSRMIDKPVNASQRYHGARREAGHYVVEPDGSLSPDDDDDAGLEFVSPPLSLEDMISDLDKVKKWADSTGCYTNNSTGLHINVSVPGLDTKKLDYIKLALLLGDKYVLNQFGRAGNHYARSAMDIVKERVVQRPEDAAALLNQMKNGLDALATKIIHSGETNKMTSINTKEGYVEFRSPGGDWLSDDFFVKIKPTLLRFVVALDAAMDPEKYRDEYLKKLYKLLQPSDKTDTLTYFAKFSAGELPTSALKSFIRQAQLERKVKKNPLSGQQYWWQVDKEGRGAANGAVLQVVASSKEEALTLAAKEWAINRSDLILRGADAYPIRPYDESPVKATIGSREPISGSTVDLQRQRAAQGGFTGAWKIVDNNGRELHRFSGVGNSQGDANRIAQQWVNTQRAQGNEIDARELDVLPVMA